ncbi:hypothetical protein B0H11DRAFT_2260889 [Mycena galericulata]|nr:hypothetical protein B0H11DRAFT_2260889 [Mycena galericulata]
MHTARTPSRVRGQLSVQPPRHAGMGGLSSLATIMRAPPPCLPNVSVSAGGIAGTCEALVCQPLDSIMPPPPPPLVSTYCVRLRMPWPPLSASVSAPVSASPPPPPPPHSPLSPSAPTVKDCSFQSWGPAPAPRTAVQTPRGFFVMGAAIVSRETPLALHKGLGAVLSGIVPDVRGIFLAGLGAGTMENKTTLPGATLGNTHMLGVSPEVLLGLDGEKGGIPVDCYYWSVVVGRVPGIYLDLDQALGQTYKFPGQKFKRCDVYQDALAYWNNSCWELHDHSPCQYFKVKGLTKAFPTYDEALAAAAAEYIISV